MSPQGAAFFSIFYFVFLLWFFPCYFLLVRLEIRFWCLRRWPAQTNTIPIQTPFSSSLFPWLWLFFICKGLSPIFFLPFLRTSSVVHQQGAAASSCSTVALFAPSHRRIDVCFPFARPCAGGYSSSSSARCCHPFSRSFVLRL